jgi:hypothetical protein
LYNRGSNRVAILRRQHAFLLVQNRFEEAEQIEALVQDAVRREERENAAIMQRDYESARKRRVEKQREEMDFFDSRTAVLLAQFEHTRDILRMGLENRGKKLEWRGRKTSDPDRDYGGVPRTARVTSRSLPKDSLPPTKLTKNEVTEVDVVILSLPPLKRPQTGKRSKVGRRGQSGESEATRFESDATKFESEATTYDSEAQYESEA